MRPERPTQARTCVGCRAEGAREALVRLVVGAEGKVTVDHRGRESGRGAWVHPTRKCMTLAAKRHAAERSLGVDVQKDLSADALVASLRAALVQKVVSLILVASRTDTLCLGAGPVERAMARPYGVRLVLCAKDAGDSSKVIAERAGEREARVIPYGTKAELGRWFGRDEVALLGLRDERIAAELGDTIDRLAGVED